MPAYPVPGGSEVVRFRRSVLIGLLLGCLVGVPAGGGAVLADGGIDEVQASPAVQDAYLGRLH